MDACSDSLTHTVVVMSGSQVGKSSCAKAIIGFHIDQDPSPILFVNPSLDIAESFSKDRLYPMFRDTPCLRDKVGDPKSKNSGSTILHNAFPGGHLTLCGANSPASLANRPIRIVICDDIDRFPVSAGTEGDPVSLAFQRSDTFWNRLHVLLSTPTVKGASRIELAYQQSDQRRFHIPCRHCGEYQVLKWGNVKWPEGDVEAAHYVCDHCGRVITDNDKNNALKHGKWRASKEFKGVAGFHLPGLYSPWSTFERMAQKRINAEGDTELLKVWVNTTLGETWEEQGDGFQHTDLMDRVEYYPEFQVPDEAILLTAGIDVQGDRLEIGIQAWGPKDESWIIHYGFLDGDTSVIQSSVWSDLDAILLQNYARADGTLMPIAMAAIDSGFNTQTVYQYARTRTRNVMAVKGLSNPGKPVHGVPTPQDVTYGGHKVSRGVRVWPIGTDTAKHHIFNRLKKTSFGPGYMHFYAGLSDDYFLGLCSEKLVTKYRRGVPYKEWMRIHTRNEPLDVAVYAFAAATRCGYGRLQDQAKPQQPQHVVEPRVENTRKEVNTIRRTPWIPDTRGFWDR